MIEVAVITSITVIFVSIVLGYAYTVKKMSESLEAHLKQIENNTKAIMAKDLTDYTQSKIAEEVIKEPESDPDIVPVSELTDDEFKDLISKAQ